MMLIAIFGVIINSLVAYFTKDGESLNQRAVNLHMFEDVIGWGVVLIGSFLIKLTKILWIDSVISIIVSAVILLRIINHLSEVLNLFLLKTPIDIDINEIKKHIMSIDEVKDVHHLHVWSLDGINNFATLHVVTNNNVKDRIRKEMKKFEINNVTIEVENEEEVCSCKHCVIKEDKHAHHQH